MTMSAMEVNDIIGMQPETESTPMESTLESEIDALSKIITDTKDGSQKTDDDEEFKLDSDDISFSTSLQYESADNKSELLSDDNLGMKDILDSSGDIEKFISAGSEISFEEEPKEQSSNPGSTNKKSKNCELAQTESANQKDESKNISVVVADQQESQSELKNESVSEIEKVLDNRIEENVDSGQEDINTIEDTDEVSQTVAEESELDLIDNADKVNKNKLGIEDIQSTAEQNKEIDRKNQLNVVQVLNLPENEVNKVIDQPSKENDAGETLREDQASKEIEVEENLTEDRPLEENKIEDALTTDKLLTENEIVETPMELENNIVQQECLNIETDFSEKPVDFIENSDKNKETESVENTDVVQEEEKKMEAEISDSTVTDSSIVAKISSDSTQDDDLLGNKKGNEADSLETEILETKNVQELMEVDEMTDITKINKQEETDCAKTVDDPLHTEHTDSGIVEEKVTDIENIHKKTIIKDEVVSQLNQIVENFEILTDDSILPEATTETTQEVGKVSITESLDSSDEKAKDQVMHSNSDSLQAPEIFENVENLQNTESGGTSSESTKEQKITENKISGNIEHKIESSNFENNHNNEPENLNDKNSFGKLGSFQSAIKEVSEISNEKMDVEDNSTQENEKSFESENIDTEDTKIEDNLKSKEELISETVGPSRIETPEDLNITLELDDIESLPKTNILTAAETEEKVDDLNESEDIKADTQEETCEDKVKPINEEKMENREKINLSLVPEGNSSPIIEDLQEEQVNLGSTLDDLIDNTNVNVEKQETMETEEPDFNEILGINENVDDTPGCDQNLQESSTNDSNEVETNFDLDSNPILDAKENISNSETLNPQDEITESMEEQSHNPFATVDPVDQEEVKPQQKLDQVLEFTELDKNSTSEQEIEEVSELPEKENVISEQEIIPVSELAEKEDNLMSEQEIDQISKFAEKEENFTSIQEIEQVSESAEKEENLILEQEINLVVESAEKQEILTSEQEVNQILESVDKEENLTSEQETDQVSEPAEKEKILAPEEVIDQVSKLAQKDENLTLMLEESSQSPKQGGEIENDLNECYIPENSEESNTDAFEDITKCNEPILSSDQNDDGTKEDIVDENVENAKMSLDLEGNEQSIENESTENDMKVTFDNADNEDGAAETSAEISEIENAVKFLQESEEQAIEASKLVQDLCADEESSSVFVSVEDSECDNASELASDMPEVTLDPIAISEAEIISEAAKLESERKEKLEMEQQLKISVQESSNLDSMDAMETSALPDTDNIGTTLTADDDQLNIEQETPLTDTLQIPQVTTETEDSPMEENEEEPIKPKQSEASVNFQVQQDSRQRIESPDRHSANEPKITETPKKDSEKQQQQQQQQQQYIDCENVGSPRIILKIAKSAITDCGEPRSPKSPKIRSAANSPNPEDSPGHKLGKIKLKLSKSGHPSIIPNEGHDEWHTDNTSSLSPLGMKIKLTKSDSSFEESQKDDPKDKTPLKSDETRKPEASIGMKIKLSKSGDASIVQDSSPKEVIQESTMKKQDSPSIGMKIKLSKTGDASIIQEGRSQSAEVKDRVLEEIQEGVRRTESPIGVKIKLSKSGDGTVIATEPSELLEAIEEPRHTDSPIGVKIKLAKTKGGSAAIIPPETNDEPRPEAEEELSKMKIKLSKSGDASVVHSKRDASPQYDPVRKTEQPIGMKIKLSKTGDPSIIHSELSKEAEDVHIGRSKHSKYKDHGLAGQMKSKDDSHLEMKIKLSKTGHPTIITTNDLQQDPLKMTFKHNKDKDLTFQDTTLKAIKKSHSDVTIEPIKSQTIENTMIDLHNKRKEITIAPIEAKKAKLDANLKQMLPDVTIQPIASVTKKEQQQQKLLLESKNANISQQQMNVINQEISITQICSLTSSDTVMGERLKNALNVHSEVSASSPLNSDCEIIEPQPELIIVNENSNSSQDVMIIDEVPSMKSAKAPKRRGRPRRNAGGLGAVISTVSGFADLEPQSDPLSLDQPPMMSAIPQQMHPVHIPSHQPLVRPVETVHIAEPTPATAEGSERPRRTCRSQKSYAPPKRGRGRGRGKRKNESVDVPMKKARIDQDLTAIENATTAIIALEKLPLDATNNLSNSPELFKALNQPTLKRVAEKQSEIEILNITKIPGLAENKEVGLPLQKEEATLVCESQDPATFEMPGLTSKTVPITESGKQASDVPKIAVLDAADKPLEVDLALVAPEESKQQPEAGKEHQNWLAPSVKKLPAEAISTLTVMDEETRMSAESCSRSQTPARNMSVPGNDPYEHGAPEHLANEESQGSTATTESEKVKVKNRRMEINFDPDEGPFTVDKIAEYEWPLDRKEERPATGRGETFMIQEQISQYLGVKSFKRKYPDLKRRMVDMEERNYLRENGLVSESMCDMGLTAVSSSEVLDIMCSDFPEQYEEYRKHMREKAAREHSKKQKELSAAANAERNRIDLAEMAMQSALSWNAGLNKARQDTRKCSLDLQTFTVHVPKRALKPESGRRGHNYPVALIPGQYTDHYREYTPAELRYFPLNTVIYGPTRPNERKFDSQSEGSQSDSDSDSSSDDSSSSSSEGTQDTEGSQSTMDEVDMELALQSDIKCKMCLNNLNKNNRPEVLIQCGTCNGNVHPSCIELTLDMVPHIRAYAWQCTDCKTCAQCQDPADEDKMLFCDMCDRGYHIYCVGLRRVPQGRWHCQECAVCANCGSKEPGGANSDRNSVAQWQHEYKKGEKNTRVYVSTFCVPCSKLWRKGRYCPHCSRCHNAPRLDLEQNLVHCGACDKYLHLGCVETKGVIIDKKNYLCDFCSPNRQQLVKPLMSKTFKT